MTSLVLRVLNFSVPFIVILINNKWPPAFILEPHFQVIKTHVLGHILATAIAERGRYRRRDVRRGLRTSLSTVVAVYGRRRR